MVERVDAKGKIFTERVRKGHVEVDIVTTRAQVHGQLHVMPARRVKDMLNDTTEQFLAVTDAIVRANSGADPQYVSFLALNKQHIISVVPVNEPHPAGVDE